MEKQRWEETAKRREKERRSEKKRNQKKEDAGARKGRKAAVHCVVPMVCVAPDGRKVSSLERQMRSHLARWEMKNCTPLWRKAHFEVKSVKNWRAEIESWDVEKVRAAVAQSTFPSQNVQKSTMLGALLEVEMSQKCTPLWHEARCQVKGAKNWGVRITFGCSDVVLRGRRAGFCTLSTMSKTWGFCSSFKRAGRRGRRSTRDMFMLVRALISWEWLHFGASDLQVC